MEITKLQRVEVPAEYQLIEGCIAFQLVQIDYDFHGKKLNDTFDTKILKDGSQIIIDGNGFFENGFKIN